MCDTCGCSDNEQGYEIKQPGQENIATEKHAEDGHSHGHGHDHGHGHGHGHGSTETISVASPVLGKNNLMAERNRGYFEAKGVNAFNLVSSPGSGKTTLLENLIKRLKNKHEITVIEGDQQTVNDANRIDQAGAKALQINTGNGCHLDAEMINDAVKQLKPSNDSLLFIENVGNLVCPALFDLGEKSRIVIGSVTEGEDKPLKYPNMFETSQLCIINKVDLLPYLEFDVEKFKENALRINHHLDFIEVSATKGDGIDKVIEWVLA
jgi:hydrogenase nickel incorporation protein HypB